ncbi:MAG: hypothetical protein FJX20_17065 [Alphaproteobacteria bacterium]|nr:hypothetical protein [Alphaproteobacteria bacterium]
MKRAKTRLILPAALVDGYEPERDVRPAIDAVRLTAAGGKPLAGSQAVSDHRAILSLVRKSAKNIETERIFH